MHWITTGVTRVTARIPAAARAALFDYPFSDNADATEVVDVVETIPAELP